MKSIIKYYVFSIITILLFTFFSALILTFLKTFSGVNDATLNIIGLVISYFIAILISYIMGLKIKRHGLIHGFIISLIFLLFNFIFGNNFSDLSNIIKISTRTLFIIFFVILGVNKSK